jgi:hypothetical protein
VSIHPALVGHGIFTEYSLRNALTRFENYGGGAPPNTDADRIARFVKAMQDMDIRSVWIQLFTRSQKFDMENGGQLRKDLIAALGHANIAWAGWGYCAGRNFQRDTTWISDFRKDLGMQAFVIDAEPGNEIWPDPKSPNDPDKKLPDLWSEKDFDTFTASINKLFGTSNLALSTWPILQIQDDEKNGNPLIKLMRIAAPRISVFAPQAYWMGYPGDPHYKFDPAHFTVQKYPRNDPTAFVRLVIDAWRILNITNKLVITGQSYWELKTRGGSPSRETMETKIFQLGNHFADWSKIAGFNWYHAGLPANSDMQGSMSDDMIAYIKSAKFGGKPYQPV